MSSLAVAAACTGPGISSPKLASPPTGTPTVVPTSAEPSASPGSASPSSPSPSPDGSPQVTIPVGTWTGTLGDDQAMFPVVATFTDCGQTGAVCGEIEYSDPMHPEFVLCAPLLVFQGVADGIVTFEEQPAYGAEECFPTTLRLSAIDATTVAVEQSAEPGVVCCRGTLTQASTGPLAPTPLPEMVGLPGFKGPLAAVDLGGETTQYVATGAGSMWFPIGGAVVRIDETGGAVAMIEAGASGPFGDPHSVVGSDDAIWVAQHAEKSIARLDPATNTIVDEITLEVAPYALALDGMDLWISSFDDDAVVRVDLSSGEVLATISVPSPTGIAVGGGSVWVVEHRNDSLARIAPDANELAETIPLGPTGDDPTCGMCVENVIFAEGSLWTANNVGRSVTRVHPDNYETELIELENRAWAVTAGRGYVWASQFEEDGHVFDINVGGLARIDPADSGVEQFSAPGTISVTWGGDALWLVTPGRRSDLAYRYVPVP